MRLRELFEWGRIVKGVNTTDDVKTDEISRQAAKFGFDVDVDGRPPSLSKKTKGSSTNVAFNLGLTESQQQEADEPVTQQELDNIKRFMDSLFAKYDMNFAFSNHFIDRVNDVRNRRQITIKELADVFRKMYVKHGESIKQLVEYEGRFQLVVRKLSSSLNLAIVVEPSRRRGEHDILVKTVMRKKNFHTKPDDRVLVIESVQLDEIERDTITKKNSLSRDDLDHLFDDAEESEHKIKGLDVYELDASEITDHGDMMLLIKDPRRNGFVGALEINTSQDGFSYSHIFMVPQLQGRGIAIELYKLAIQEYGFDLVSDETQTPGSESVWAKLSRTPGIQVYAWNRLKDTYHQWSPDEDDADAVYHDTTGIEELKQEKKDIRGELMNKMMKGEITKDDFRREFDQRTAGIDQQLKSLESVKSDDIRLVATEKDLN